MYNFYQTWVDTKITYGYMITDEGFFLKASINVDKIFR